MSPLRPGSRPNLKYSRRSAMTSPGASWTASVTLPRRHGGSTGARPPAFRAPPLRYHGETMSFQWLQMRIQEEKERRQREANILERLPRALEELHRSLIVCVED